MKRPLCVLAGLLAATLLAGAASAADLISLRLGDVKGDRYAALRASGELDDLPYKLEMSAFPSGAPVLEALNAGALDIGFTGDIPFLFVYAAGAPLKAVGAWHFNPATVALVVGRTRRSVRWPASRASALPSIAAAGGISSPLARCVAPASDRRT